MKRSRTITLVLLGGGVAIALGGCGDRRREECDIARRELRPDAEQICARSAATGSRSSGGSWLFGRGSDGNAQRAALAGAAAGSAASSRGGFGGTAAAHGSGS